MRISITIDFQRSDAAESEQRETSADALVERADPHQPPIGFVPKRPDQPGDLRQET